MRQGSKRLPHCGRRDGTAKFLIMPDRRFNETEVATIIERASAVQEGRGQMVPAGSGMTLAELQEIGREVGIDPAILADAARSVDEVPAESQRGFLGLAMRVGRVVQLERPVTSEEWERMVVDLRETFNARGVMRGEGSLRQWSNGNLQALLEPTAAGMRVRLRTYKEDAMPRVLIGLLFLATPVIRIATAMAAGSTIAPGRMYGLGAVAAGGLVVIAMTAVSVRQWANRRMDQMERLAARWKSKG